MQHGSLIYWCVCMLHLVIVYQHTVSRVSVTYMFHFLCITSCIEYYILLKSQIWHASRVLFQAVCAWSTSKHWLVEQWRVISIKCYRSLTTKNSALCDMSTVFIHHQWWFGIFQWLFYHWLQSVSLSVSNESVECYIPLKTHNIVVACCTSS